MISLTYLQFILVTVLFIFIGTLVGGLLWWKFLTGDYKSK